MSLNNSLHGQSLPKNTRREALTMALAAGAGAILPGSVFGRAHEQVTFAFASGGPEIMWAPHFIAEAEGYYKEEGLTVRRVFSGGGPASMAALVSGSGITSFCPPGELLVAAGRGQKFKILVAQSNYVPLFMLMSKAYAAKHKLDTGMPLDQKIAALRGMKGLKVGVTAPGSMTDKFARRALDQAGLNPASDAQVVPMGSVQNAVAAMSRDTLDAVISSAPASDVAIAEFGAVPFLNLAKEEVKGFKSLAGHLIQARASDVAEKPDLFEAIVRAEVRGFRHIIDDPNGAGAVLGKTQFASLRPEVWQASWKMNLPLFQTPYVTVDSVEAWIKLDLVPGVTDPAAANVKEIVDMRFVDNAVSKIGWKIPA